MERLSASLDARWYGGKAAGLALLIHLGFDVPDGFAISASEPLDESRVWTAASRWTGGMDCDGSARVAIRSSAPGEDARDASHAGEFLSVIGTFSCSELIGAIEAVRASGPDDVGIPVVVQTVVEPEFAGVAFSCDPIDLTRGRMAISWVAGLGGPLVGGEASGTTVSVASDDPKAPEWPAGDTALRALVEGARRIEAALDGPADVEWAIDAHGTVWMLQARPVVLPSPRAVNANSEEELQSLPPAVAAHSKMRLRLAAARRGVPMSNAVVVTTSGSAPPPALPADLPGGDAAALSLVLLCPNRLEDKVVREFAQVDRTDVPLFTLGCRRYSIRRYPVPDAASHVLGAVLAQGLTASWTASAVVQEIYDAEATGIARRMCDGFVVELARGHFVPKGVVDPTRLVLSSGGDVLAADRRDQSVVYHFINGHVVTEQPAERQLDLSEAEIADATMQIAPLFLDYPDAALEFGVLKRRGSVQGYVIDVAEADSAAAAASLTTDMISTGVLSPGRGRGRIVRVRNSDQADLDSHLLSNFGSPKAEDLAQVVIFADRASVDLLPLASRLARGSAFVFRRASLLAHLSVVLRESGIPAIVVDDDDVFAAPDEGQDAEVDAASSKLDGRERLTVMGGAR